MDFYDNMKQIFSKQREIALATSVDNKANVRLVDFCTDDEKDGVLYFATFIGTPKTKEFAANSVVAFTTVPYGESEHVRVQGASIVKSSKSVYDLLNKFVAKDPHYGDLVEKAGNAMEIYEIHFKEASVITSEMQQGTVSL